MDNVSINRAQYDIRKHRDGFSKASKHEFNMTCEFDNEGNPRLDVQIIRKSDDFLVHQEYAYSFEEAEDIISEWRAQLNIESTDTNMW